MSEYQGRIAASDEAHRSETLPVPAAMEQVMGPAQAPGQGEMAVRIIASSISLACCQKQNKAKHRPKKEM